MLVQLFRLLIALCQLTIYDHNPELLPVMLPLSCYTHLRRPCTNPKLPIFNCTKNDLLANKELGPVSLDYISFLQFSTLFTSIYHYNVSYRSLKSFQPCNVFLAEFISLLLIIVLAKISEAR